MKKTDAKSRYSFHLPFCQRILMSPIAPISIRQIRTNLQGNCTCDRQDHCTYLSMNDTFLYTQIMPICRFKTITTWCPYARKVKWSFFSCFRSLWDIKNRLYFYKCSAIPKKIKEKVMECPAVGSIAYNYLFN